MKNRFEVLNVVANKFYFGIGGIGDFLLLMSTFYDDIEKDTDVIFVANNVNTIREIGKLFPKINRLWLYPNKAFPKTEEMWEEIANHKLCLGTGVTPKGFDYIGEWIECSKVGVHSYYGVRTPVSWISPIQNKSPKRITIHPCGSKDYNRVSRIPKEFIKSIIDKYNDYEIVLIGSNSDINEYGGVIDKDHYLFGAKWLPVEFETQMHYIRSCDIFIGVNSWCKTYAAMAGSNAYIYPSTYKVEPQKAYGWHKDPSDCVFLDGYGFKNANWLV